MKQDKHPDRDPQHVTKPTASQETVTPDIGNAQDGSAGAQERRRLLQAVSAAGLGGAAALPTHWSRPVVDSVLLPAHAQATPAATQPACNITCTFEATGIFLLSSNAIDLIDNTFVAQCVSENGDTSFSSAVFTYSATGTGGQGSAYSEFLQSTGTFSTFATLQDVYGTATTNYFFEVVSGVTTVQVPC